MKRSGLNSPWWMGSIKLPWWQDWFWNSQLYGRRPQRCTSPPHWREEASCQKISMRNELFPGRDVYSMKHLPHSAHNGSDLRLTYTWGSSNSSHHCLTLSLCVEDHISCKVSDQKFQFFQLQGVQRWASNLQQLFRMHLGNRRYTIMWNDWHIKIRKAF